MICMSVVCSLVQIDALIVQFLSGKIKWMQCHIKRHAYQELFSVFHELYFIFREQFVYIHELIYAAIYIIYDTFIVKI